MLLFSLSVSACVCLDVFAEGQRNIKGLGCMQRSLVQNSRMETRLKSYSVHFLPSLLAPPFITLPCHIHTRPQTHTHKNIHTHAVPQFLPSFLLLLNRSHFFIGTHSPLPFLTPSHLSLLLPSHFFTHTAPVHSPSSSPFLPSQPSPPHNLVTVKTKNSWPLRAPRGFQNQEVKRCQQDQRRPKRITRGERKSVIGLGRGSRTCKNHTWMSYREVEGGWEDKVRKEGS